ncbi:hypothetical protein ACS0PU_012008 [Formica fusca]
MKAYLQSEDLWECVEGTSEYVIDTKKNTKARAKIILSVDKRNLTSKPEIQPKKPVTNLKKPSKTKD